MNKKKVLFIGPFPQPYGGIANHTQLLFKSNLKKYFNPQITGELLHSFLKENYDFK